MRFKRFKILRYVQPYGWRYIFEPRIFHRMHVR